MQLPTTQICTSEVTLAELTYGAINCGDYDRYIKEPQKLRRDGEIYDISEVFEEYGQIRCALKKIRKDLDREVGQRIMGTTCSSGPTSF